MSDPLAERLSRLTPDGTGLDRDGLLFSAGRLSARPNRPWQALAAALGVAWALTLFFLWPRPEPGPVSEPPRQAAPAEPSGPTSPAGPEMWLLTRQVLRGSAESLPAPTTVTDPAPPAEPLHVYTTHSWRFE
jgi:hypothetical protein